MPDKQLAVSNEDGPTTIHGLSDDRKRQLYEQLRSIEHLEAEIGDLREDCNEQKKLMREGYNIEADVLTFVLKRRKKTGAERAGFDDAVAIFEEAMVEMEEKRRDQVRSSMTVVENDDPLPE